MMKGITLTEPKTEFGYTSFKTKNNYYTEKEKKDKKER